MFVLLVKPYIYDFFYQVEVLTYNNILNISLDQAAIHFSLISALKYFIQISYPISITPWNKIIPLQDPHLVAGSLIFIVDV